MRIAVAGSTGLIGSALGEALRARGDEVLRLVRPDTGAEGIFWDPARGSLEPGALDGVDAVINLAGRSIGERRWSDREKTALLSSRVDSSRLLGEAVVGDGVPVLLNASAIGFYGDRGDEPVTETAARGTGFLAELTAEWEAATGPAAAAGVRVALLRTGMVLTRRGGALAKMLAPFGPSWLSPFKWGWGGRLGSGRQVWSWISLEDQVRAVLHVLDGGLDGPVNLTGPAPATNREFTRALSRLLRRPAVIPIPAFALEILLGSELAQGLLLDGARVVPERLTRSGFEFAHPDLDAALAAAFAV